MANESEWWPCGAVSGLCPLLVWLAVCSLCSFVSFWQHTVLYSTSRRGVNCRAQHWGMRRRSREEEEEGEAEVRDERETEMSAWPPCAHCATSQPLAPASSALASVPLRAPLVLAGDARWRPNAALAAPLSQLMSRLWSAKSTHAPASAHARHQHRHHHHRQQQQRQRQTVSRAFCLLAAHARAPTAKHHLCLVCASLVMFAMGRSWWPVGANFADNFIRIGQQRRKTDRAKGRESRPPSQTATPTTHLRPGWHIRLRCTPKMSARSVVCAHCNHFFHNAALLLARKPAASLPAAAERQPQAEAEGESTKKDAAIDAG